MSIPSSLVKNALKVARGAESWHSTTALKSAIRNDVESITEGYGKAANLVQGLTEYAAYGGKIPSRKTIGTQPSQKGVSFMLGVDDAAERLGWGVNAASDYPRVPKGTVSRSAPATRNMSSAQRGAMIARKRKKSGPKGGMR